mmetsp:Transcript_5888/g.10541  ORF Transcript_5888/g.10541 Transcript_5888/m.10541 type:complete len:116 (+) Transcript_5888:39-386(+)
MQNGAGGKMLYLMLSSRDMRMCMIVYVTLNVWGDANPNLTGQNHQIDELFLFGMEEIDQKAILVPSVMAIIVNLAEGTSSNVASVRSIVVLSVKNAVMLETRAMNAINHFVVCVM